MADRKRVSDDFATEAALAAGKSAAKRAVEDLLSTDEEKAQQEAEDAAKSKRKRTKLIAFGVVGLLIVLGVIGLVINYWQWFILAGVVGLVALFGYSRLRKRFRSKRDKSEEPAQLSAKSSAKELPARDDAKSSALDHDEASLSERAGQIREERARAAAARKEARALEEHEVDEELAALKARLKK